MVKRVGARAFCRILFLQAISLRYNYLFNTSKRHDRLNILFDFAFDETLRKGEIYIDDTNSAVALWLFEKKEKLSLNFIPITIII